MCLVNFSHDLQAGTNQRIATTSKDLQRLTVVVRRGDKQQKLQVEKLTSDFTHVVQMYSKSQQVTQDLQLFSSSY